nr:MAG TPA: hypothetical protein [Caudoviricetes sp.]
MSRRDGTKDTSELSEWIDEYKAGKDKENALKKANSALNENIKAYMYEHDMERASSDNYVAVVTTQKKESLNEELAIEIIKKNLGDDLLKSVIKQKEYIDEDALEKLVYNGDFDIIKLSKAKITKLVTTLRISKKK